MGCNYVAHKQGHVERDTAAQEKENRSEDVPRLERLQLCDEVEDQGNTTLRGGPSGGQTAVNAKTNVDRHTVEYQSVSGHHTTCMATAVQGCVK
jgi:hypothetical protein